MAEFLVTMSTHVPDGTPGAAVDEIRTREAARARQLADAGQLLRLWRPPLQPGEWRTLGLFAAADSGSLEDALASMPLRVWRSDEVTALLPHPNDPGPPGRAHAAGSTPPDRAEYLTWFTLTVPEATPEATVNQALAAESARARELAAQGHLLRLWALGGPRALGLWRADGQAQMDRIVAALPLGRWLATVSTPLTAHPNDPGGRAAGGS